MPREVCHADAQEVQSGVKAECDGTVVKWVSDQRHAAVENHLSRDFSADAPTNSKSVTVVT